MVAYTNWTVGEKINICAQVEDFCGNPPNQFLFLMSADMQKDPNGCSLTCNSPPNCPWECIDTTGRQVIFRSVRHYIGRTNDVKCSNVTASRIYRDIGSATSDSGGTASIQHTVTEQDRLDYLDAVANGQSYDIVCCINASVNMIGNAQVFLGITVANIDRCAGITCPNICVGNNLYSQTCDPATGSCIQGALIQPSPNPTCLTIGNLAFDSNPQGAEIWLASSPNTPIYRGVQTPNTISDLPAGTYNYIIKRTNYQDFTGQIDVLPGQTVNIYSPLVPIPGRIYDLKILISNETTGATVTNRLQKFTDLLNDWILSKLSNIVIDDVTYDPVNHQVVVQMEEVQTTSLYGIPTYQRLDYYHDCSCNFYENSQNRWSISQSIDFMSQPEYNNPTIKSLILPLLAVEFILYIAPFVAVLIGWVVASILFGEHTVVPAYATLQVNIVEMTNEVAASPTKDVTVEFNGETKFAFSTNNYTVSFTNVEIGKTYPISAYIPLTTDSKVREASIDCTLSPCSINISSDPVNYYTAKLRINNIAQRDFKPCNLKLDNGNAVPQGTIMRVYNPITLANGDVTLDTLGTTTVGADGCAVDIIKVPANLSDSHFKIQFIVPTDNPNDPAPTLIDGDKTEVPTFNGEKNTISVSVSTTIGGYPIPDRIDIIDISTDTIIKSILPDKYISLVTGIPRGTYRISVIMTGYRQLSCTPTSCEVTFNTDYLGSNKVNIVLESIEKTCSLQIYARDNDGKPPKSQVYISIDDKPEILTNEGALLVPTIVAKSHKFSIRADAYGTVTENRTIACTDITEVQIFKMTQTGQLPIPSSMSMTVNDLLGSVQVNKDTQFTIRVIGGNVGETVNISNISSNPDAVLATGIIGGDGTFQTQLTFSSDITFELQAQQGCLLGICQRVSNIVEIKVGKGSPTCAVPNPFGGCLVEQTTGYGLIAIAGLALIFGITLLGRGAGASPAGRVVSAAIPPHYTPPEIRERTQLRQ